jgi:hypothetical protein
MGRSGSCLDTLIRSLALAHKGGRLAAFPFLFAGEGEALDLATVAANNSTPNAGTAD